MEGKVAILGDADFVMPFSALGVDTFTVENAKQATENAKKIIDNVWSTGEMGREIIEGKFKRQVQLLNQNYLKIHFQVF